MFKRIIYALVLSICLLGCPEVGVVEDGLVLIDEVPKLEVVNISSNTIDLFSGTGDTPLAVGDIIIGETNGGYLRKVVSMSQKGASIQAETVIAELTDVVESGMLIQNIQFTPDDYEKSGLDLNNLGHIDFSGTDIYRDNGIAISVDDGVLDCTPEVNMIAIFDKFKLSTFDLSMTGTLSLDLDLKAAVDENATLSIEENLITPITYPFVTSIGPIPVYGAAKLSFPIGIVGSFEGDTSVVYGFDISNDFLVDVSYSNDEWVTTNDSNNWIINEHPPIWSLEVGFGVQLYIKAIVEVSLYEAAELGLFVKPYLDAHIYVIPPPIDVLLFGGLDAGGWYGLSIFDMNILGDSFYWNGLSEEVFTWTQ